MSDVVGPSVQRPGSGSFGRTGLRHPRFGCPNRVVVTWRMVGGLLQASDVRHGAAGEDVGNASTPPVDLG
jgi:hypothetical protein